MKRRPAIAAAFFLGTTALTFAQSATPKTLLILGDSLTEGYGVLPSEAYPALLQKRLGKNWKIINGGLSGDTSAGGLRRLAWFLKTKPNALIIALGGNDGLRGIAPASTQKNLTAIIDQARATNPTMKILLAGINAPGNLGTEFLTQFKATFPAVAKEKNIPLLENLLLGVEGDPALNQPDRIHPNAAGHIKLADTIWKTLASFLETP